MIYQSALWSFHTCRGEGSGPKGDVGPKGDRGEKGNKVLEYREVIFPKGTIKRFITAKEMLQMQIFSFSSNIRIIKVNLTGLRW